MLRQIKAPIVCKHRGHTKQKVVHLGGLCTPIHKIAERRGSNRHYNPSHYNLDQFFAKQHIRVSYILADDGFIAIYRVYVKVDTQWICFFDKGTSRVGVIIGKGTEYMPQFVYMAEHHCDDFIEAIGRIEDRLMARNLAKLPPDSFETDEEIAMAVQQETREVHLPLHPRTAPTFEPREDR